VEQADPGTPPLDAAPVLLEREDLLVLDKPAGMLVHRTAGEATRTVEALFAARFPGERVESAHRLDRDTSGCLVAGRGLDAIRELRALFAGSLVEKRYAALVSDPAGLWVPGAPRTLDEPLGLDSVSEVRLRVGRGSWLCATHVRCERRRGDRALLDVTIEGGRQHQIRAHLALFGTPVVGDKLYEAGSAFFLDWIDRPGAPDLVARLPARWHCLHARALRLPWRGASIEVEAPLPPAFEALLAAQPRDL
jgi:23S rRNA pseudouridine1911/1915/1917 synthase